MSDQAPRATLSNKQARGGVIGSKGYGFQAAYIVSRIPRWLADPDFVQFLQEGASDVDVHFSRPNGEKRWYVQVKNHEVKPAEGREVLTQFHDTDAGTPRTYTRFILACRGLHTDLKRLRTAVEEFRGVAPFYQPGEDAIFDNTRADLEALVTELGLPVSATFLVEKVDFDTDLAGLTDDASLRDLFAGRLRRLEPWTKVTSDGADHIYEKLALLSHQVIRQTLSREQVEALINESLSELSPEIAYIVPSHVPFILPQLDVSTFTGREDELGHLEELLLRHEGPKISSIAGLTGAGGIGKSALACHFAELHQADFPDGVIGLRVDDKDVDTIAREFARCCREEIDPDDERHAATIIQDVFRHRRTLLIFDNADDAAIRPLFPGGDRCAVIVTTRDRGLPILLDIPAEGRIDLSPLPDPDSVRLLERLVGVERVTAQWAVACEIIHMVGNLPLALQIVGAALQMQSWRSLADYADSLREERARLARLRIRGDAHLDVRASFSLSLGLLNPQEVNFFACLSVCAEDGFSVHAAMAAGDCDEPMAQERLAFLHRLSLLNRPRFGADRFVFHPLIRLFAQELTAERALQDGAEERHAHFFVQFVKASDVQDRTAASALADELDDIVLAAKWLQSQGRVDNEFVTRLEPFFERHGHWHHAINLMSGFLALAERVEDWHAAAQLRIQQAKYLSLRGDWPEALEVLNPVADIVTEIKAPAVAQHCEAMWLNTLGGVLQRLGRFDDAVDAFQRSQAISEKLGDQRGLAMVLNSLGGVLQRLGRFDEAVVAFQRSQVICEESGNQRSLAMVLNSLGGVLQRLGRFDEAVDAFQRSQAISEELGDQRSLAMVLNSLGGVLQRLGRFDEAVDAFRRSQAIAEELGDQRSLAMVLNSLGGVLQRLGRFDEAVDAFQRSQAIAEELGDRRHLAMVLNSLGGVLQRLGRFDEAVNAFQRSQAIAEELGDRRHLAMVLNSLGGVLQRLGRFDDAVDAFQRSQAIAEELGDQRGLAMVLNSLGGVLRRQGRFHEAVDIFQRSATIEQTLGNQRGLAMVLTSLGRTLQRLKRFEDAEDTLRRSLAIEEQLGNQQGQAKVLNGLGGVLQDQGRFDEAIDAFKRGLVISKGLHDRRGEAMVHTAMGKAWLSHGDDQEAANELCRGFEIDECLENRRGMNIVTPVLVDVLLKLDRRKEALAYCTRALTVAPKSRRLLELRDQLTSPEETTVRNVLKHGTVKDLIRHPTEGHFYGFIAPDDDTAEIYFREGYVDLSGLAEGVRVEVEVEQGPIGPRATSVKVID